MPSNQNNEMIQIPKNEMAKIENRLNNLESQIKQQENLRKQVCKIITSIKLQHSFFVDLFLKAYDEKRIITQYIKKLPNPEEQNCMKQLWKMFHKNPTPPINTPPQA